MSILSIILVVILAMIAVVVGIAAGKPKTFTIKRAAEIKAPPETIFALIEDFHRWTEWSPYEGVDPHMKKTFDGPSKGVGAGYGWDGDKKAGAGRMVITEITPGKVALDLTLLRPFRAQNKVEFFITPLETATRTAWVMTGPAPFASKLMGVFVNMDRLVGKDFETGLARLKAVAEG